MRKKIEKNGFESLQVEKTNNQIRKIGGEIGDETSSLHDERQFITDYMKDIERKNASFLTRWTLSSHEKNLAQSFQNLQLNAFTDLAEQRNMSLRAIGDTQLELLREICNGILQTGRSTIQGTVRVNFMENFQSFINELDSLNDEFVENLEAKLEKVKLASETSKDMLWHQIQMQKQKWMSLMDDVYNDFCSILNKRV